MRILGHLVSRCFFALALLSLAAALALGQSATGEVTGSVTDNMGAVVPAATVKLLNTATRVSDQTATNGSGNYVFINVQPGSYTLTVENSGFKTAQANFTISVNQTLTQNITLDLGSVNETVTVSSEAPLIQTSSTNLGTVITEQAVKELPLNGRNFTQLMILTPGANPVSTAQGSGISFQDAGVTGIPGTQFFKPSLHGQPNRSVLYYLDGITNTDFRGSIYGVLPIIDAVNEFKVQSHNEKTEFGGVIGGIVNLVSNSGTNQFHGSAWEFVRNNAFDARDPFRDFCSPARCGPGSSSTTPASPAPYRQNEFGVAGGGPIVRNKTFSTPLMRAGASANLRSASPSFPPPRNCRATSPNLSITNRSTTPPRPHAPELALRGAAPLPLLPAILFPPNSSHPPCRSI